MHPGNFICYWISTLWSAIEVAKVVISTLIVFIYHSLKACIPANRCPKKCISDQIVLITGAGSGIGQLLAIEMAKLGARVVIWDIDEQAAKVTAEIIKRTPIKYLPNVYKVDVSDRVEVYKYAQIVIEELGEVDILINNAGIVTGQNFVNVLEENFVKTLQVNCLAHVWTCKAFLPSMIQRKFGHLVTIASAAGIIAIPGLTDYCTSKFAAVGFMEALASELNCQGHKNIQTTLVCPYYMDTGMFKGVTTKFASTMPILSPEWSAKKILDAILMNQKFVAFPRMIYLFFILKSILPIKALFHLQHVMEVSKSMENFVGRRGKRM